MEFWQGLSRNVQEALTGNHKICVEQAAQTNSIHSKIQISKLAPSEKGKPTNVCAVHYSVSLGT